MKRLSALLFVLIAGAAACSHLQGTATRPQVVPSATLASPVRVSTPVVSDLSAPLTELVERARSAPHIPVERDVEDEEGGGGHEARRTPSARRFVHAGEPPRFGPAAGGLASMADPNPTTILQNFDGLTTADVGASGFAADSSGAIGPNHYIDAANFSFVIYDRTGTRLAGPSSTAAFWNGFAAAPCGGGWSDVVVLYDRTADRWFVSRFARGPSNEWYQCFAISQTADPTQQYFRYAYKISDTEFNDYPKFGIWPDGYYMTAQRNKIFPGLGVFVAAFERSKMLTGDPSAQGVLFVLDNNGNRAGMLPADWDGQTAPPAAAPNYLVRPRSSQLGWPGADALEVWSFHVDWTTPAASTLVLSDTLAPTPYTPACLFNQNCIPQPGTPTSLDPLASGYLMYRLAYRNFGSHEALVLNHTVDNGDLAPAVHAGVRWYELRRSGAAWSIFQQATHAPDADHRWIGSVAMDQQGNLAVGYNVSGSRFPSLAYAFRLAGDPAGTLSTETTIQEGGGAQTGFIFWGDYSQLTLDPIDDCTFWYVGAYQPSTSATQIWNQRIAAFRLPSCPKAATSLTYTGATTQDFHDTATLSATLLNTFFGSYPVAGETITFHLGTQSCNAVTTVAGSASCNLVIDQAAGNYPLTASFAGTAQLQIANFAGVFTVTHEETTTTYTGPTVIANGVNAAMSGVLKEDGITPIAGRTLTFTIGTGPTAQSCAGLTNAAGTASCNILVAQPLGPNTVTASFAGDAFYLPSSDTDNTILFEFLASGSFVIGDQSQTGAVTFWASDWSVRNALTGGAAPSAFKGFAGTLSAQPPGCGVMWTTTTGNSPKPPALLPSYMAVLVSGAVAQSGPVVSGDGPKIVVVQTATGYSNNPGHPGRGLVVATFCQ